MACSTQLAANSEKQFRKGAAKLTMNFGGQAGAMVRHGHGGGGGRGVLRTFALNLDVRETQEAVIAFSKAVALSGGAYILDTLW